MAERVSYQPVLPFIGVLYRDEGTLSQAVEKLRSFLSPFDLKSEVISFSYTDYYENEMGAGILRCWLACTKLSDPADLAGWKLRTDKIERELSTDGRRRINLDPGFVGLSKVVLASLKDHPQRIPLHAGVYAEIELIFNNGEWDDLPWTYWDYADTPAKDFLRRVRSELYRRLKGENLL